jgi:hypothetical protein
MIIANDRGRPLAVFPTLDGLPASRVVWRSDLYRALHDYGVANGVRFVFDKRLVDIRDPRGQRSAFCRRGSGVGRHSHRRGRHSVHRAIAHRPRCSFAACEALRRPRVEKVAAYGARSNNSKVAGPVAKTLMNVMLPIAMKTFLTPKKMFGWTHGHHIDWDATAVV